VGRRRKERKREARGGRRGRAADAAQDASPAALRQEAARRADQKVKLVGELARFALVCGLLLVFVPPVGVVVGFFWGIGLAKRVYAAWAVPALRSRWTEEALADEVARPEARNEPAPPRPVLRDVAVAELLDAALAERSAELATRGIALRRAIDAPGSVRADAQLLGRALAALLDRALAALPPAAGSRLEVAAGQNLAGSAAWVRISARGPGAAGGERARADDLGRELAPARRIVEAHAGTLEVHASPEAGLELLATLPAGEGAGRA
jgi:hypothetical protein